MKAFAIIVGILAALILVALMAIGYAMEFGYLPTSEVYSEDTLPEEHLKVLREEKVIDADEIVRYFYSAGFWSIMEDGNLFTDRRVISYETYDDEFFFFDAPFAEITDIRIKPSEDFWDYSEVTISTDDTWFVLILDNTGGMDDVFYTALKEVWEEKRPPETTFKPKSMKK